jgi:paraquat-inducible protein B
LYQDLAHSQRGVIVKLDLPDGEGLKAGSTPLMYQGWKSVSSPNWIQSRR